MRTKPFDVVAEHGMTYTTGKSQQIVIRTLGREPSECRIIDTPDVAAQYWREHVTTRPDFDEQREMVIGIMLDVRKKPIGYSVVSIGLLDQSLVMARELFRPAIAVCAHSVVLMHNHPSGDPTPSSSDVTATRELVRCGRMLKIELCDHVIVAGENQHISMRSIGLWV